jgi:opacity protein-like surface antigen
VPDEQPVEHSREGRMPPPPVVVYQPRQTSSPRPQIIIIAPGGTHIVRRGPPAHVRRAPVIVRKTRVRTTLTPVRPVVQRRWQSEWGINARIEGVGFGGDRNSDMAAARDAGMGGFGLSLRYRPWAHFALDAGFDVIGGTDFNGFERVETPFAVNGILYFNPRSRSQFYVIGGVNWSRATVRSDDPSPLLAQAGDGNGYSADYKYFGGQLGVGLEFRLSKRLAFNVDLLGFVRSRSDVDDDGGKHHNNDDATDKPPEFINAETGQTTNTSGGGLFRGGLTLWW